MSRIVTKIGIDRGFLSGSHVTAELAPGTDPEKFGAWLISDDAEHAFEVYQRAAAGGGQMHPQHDGHHYRDAVTEWREDLGYDPITGGEL